MAKGEKNTRKRYTAAQKERAQKLYMKSVSVTEIAELLNIELPTVKKWRAAGKWQKIREITVINKPAETIRLFKAGNKQKDIAKLLDISLSTVYRTLKNAGLKDENNKNN